MDPARQGQLRRRLLLQPREFQQMVISLALLRIGEDFIGADDLSEFQRSVRIARSEVGVGALDGSTERGPEFFCVIVWKRPEQIVKRLHHRSRC